MREYVTDSTIQPIETTLSEDFDVVRPRQSQSRMPRVDFEGEDVRAGSIGRLTSKDLPRFGPSS